MFHLNNPSGPFSLLLITCPKPSNLPQRCPTARTGDEEQAQWRARFAPPIIARLERFGSSYVLEDRDALNFAELCAFETLAGDGAVSPFCGLFERDEWEGVEWVSLGEGFQLLRI